MTNIREDLAFASIHYLAPKIHSGDISPVELTEISLERVVQHNDTLNAFIDVWHDEAIVAAQNAETEIAQGNYRGSLHGIPIALKDLVDVKGKVTTGGSTVLKDNVATKNATITDRFNNAGAITIGKTHLVEFALGSAGVNPHMGDVHNPWNLTRVTGGSSSGSGAAVSAGLVYGAIGSDTGGSIRMPASLCGIAGIKPTYGRVPRTGILDLSWSSDHVGPMTRRTADCAHMLNAIAGHDPLDNGSANIPVPDFAADLDKGLDGIRIGVPEDYFFDPEVVHPEVSEAVTTAIELLERNGAELVPIPMPWVADGRAINQTIVLAEALAVHENLLPKHADEYTPAVRSRIQIGLSITAVDYIRAQRARQMFAEKMAHATKHVHAIATPSIPPRAPTIADCSPAPGEAIAEKASDIPLFTSIADVTGQPSHSVPCGFDSDGMPIGLMITGKSFDEATVLRIGHAYEELAGWHTKRPPIN